MRSKDGRPLVSDGHLWTEVARTVRPLAGRTAPRRSEAPLPLPPSPQHPAIASSAGLAKVPSLPSPYRPAPANPGIEPKLARRLRRGQVEIDGSIDLHGMRQDEARAALLRFIPARAARGDRTVLVVTGKGLKKTDSSAFTIIERGVLRAMLPVWLSEPGLAPLVSGWSHAARSHGGEGAFYVRLRRGR